MAWRKYRGAAAAAVAGGALILMGCGFKGGATGDETPDGERGAQAHWQMRPVRMRVYPSSRFVREDAVAMLEARVELADENGDTTKAVGQFLFELFGAGRASQPRVGARLYGWSVEVLTREQNLTFYDPITRAYLFRLRLDSLGVVGEASLLRISFLPAGGGPRLAAEAIIGRESGVLDEANVRFGER